MIIIKILLAHAAIFAVFHIIKMRISSNKMLSIITFGMAIGVALVLFPYKTIQFTGIGIYFVSVFLTIVYGITAKKLPTKSRLIICLMAAPIFTYWLWLVNHWHGNIMLLPVITLFAGLTGMVMKTKLKTESGILILLTTDAIAIILEYWLKLP
jgi:hypothetical protein